MSEQTFPLNALAIGGYRSFGEIQRFEQFTQINLLIGQNNCGKSNVLRFLHKVYPYFTYGYREIKNDGRGDITEEFHLNEKVGKLKLDELDKHKPSKTKFFIGKGMTFPQKDSDFWEFNKLGRRPLDYDVEGIFKVFKEKSRLDKLDKVWFYFDEMNELVIKSRSNNWHKAFKVMTTSQLSKLYMDLRAPYQHYDELPEPTFDAIENFEDEGPFVDYASFPSGNSPCVSASVYEGEDEDTQRMITKILKSLCITYSEYKDSEVVLIPAIREIGKQGSVSEEFSGEGIINRLGKLERPSIHKQDDKNKFRQVEAFLRTVIGNEKATIEIPYEGDTILVQIDGKTLPLESLSTGIHEVIILAAAATILENTVICMEEPELHLNPLLQKKLVRYLATTSNQYFITTHSAALMDTPNAEIYHIRMENGQSIVKRASSDTQRSEICQDLGYHPSDLLQANCVIWVEGPSDRIYLNYWINAHSPTLIEGIHYSIMFYGGRLASHLSGADLDQMSIKNFISLRRLNRRGVIVLDSDKENKSAGINTTKEKLCDEFNQNEHGVAWLTQGREIENYLPENQIREAIASVHPSAKSKGKFGQYDNVLSITTNKEKTGGSIKPQKVKPSQADKVRIAKYIVDQYPADFSRLDLKDQVEKLVAFIKQSNP